MQLAIELPDELCLAVLQHNNVQDFIKRAIEKELSSENKSPLFEQLRLNDDCADDELALLFERNNDTGRDIML